MARIVATEAEARKVLTQIASRCTPNTQMVLRDSAILRYLRASAHICFLSALNTSFSHAARW
jgi:hypothetical protein